MVVVMVVVAVATLIATPSQCDLMENFLCLPLASGGSEVVARRSVVRANLTRSGSCSPAIRADSQVSLLTLLLFPLCIY